MIWRVSSGSSCGYALPPPREGPGERRHDLMSVEQTQPLLRLRKLVIGLFEDDRQAPGLTKTHLIHVAPRRTLVNAELLNYISVIFAPLKDLIFEFLSLISTAYEENRTDAHAVYDDVLRLFDKHISSSQKEGPSELKLREDEEEPRVDDVGNAWDTPPSARRIAQPSSKDETGVTSDDDPPLSPTPQPKRPRTLQPLQQLSNDRGSGQGSSSPSSSRNRPLRR
ncbi:hypothetical protein EVJ58_g2140 [Rhodofomes roseus]|uniref:Uncharacterized protein n=1 Tax=Rhodofomes roseus TaxID=34475 RepID=A0A4Y9YTY4_9APHY|nr:hypothetical protein EVJ58_g2140 [Rhodofomes roseus]